METVDSERPDSESVDLKTVYHYWKTSPDFVAVARIDHCERPDSETVQHCWKVAVAVEKSDSETVYH